MAEPMVGDGTADAGSAGPRSGVADESAELLSAVVAGIGGQSRPGQDQMVEVVADALAGGSHALVQAGTGTGKSVGYLVPAIAHVRAGAEPVVVATATLALQHQLVSRDLPAINEALAAAGKPPVSFAVLKGRANYVCKQRLHDPIDGPEQPELVGMRSGEASKLEKQAATVRDWALEDTTTGDRDELDDIDGRVWRSFSVTAKECVGATKCAFGEECFAEAARARAGAADIVVTNHALLALDAVENLPVLPEHSAVIVDEGHELVDRATAAVTAELSPAAVGRALSGARRLVSTAAAELMERSATGLQDALFEQEGRLPELPDVIRAALAGVRDAAHAVLAELAGGDTSDPDAVARKQRARSAVEEVHDVAGAVLAAGDESVVWVSRTGGGRLPSLHIAPLSMAGPLRAGLFDESSVVVTSATLTLGGDFEPVARGFGLRKEDRDATGPGGWRAVDVGSPFDFAKQGILYVAADLPRPGRDGPTPEALDTMAELVAAAGGRALVLYSSWRGVEAAEERLAESLDGQQLLVQQRGDSVGSLVRRFAADPTSVLVGTMSLWQGVDVSGDACILVVIDRIPFPRPDDPVLQARSERVEAAGGSGFATVSVPRAALLLAQGAGRLIRSATDRGVVAVLDQRLVRSGYGRTLVRSMPPLWLTTDRAVVTGALERLAEKAEGAASTG